MAQPELTGRSPELTTILLVGSDAVMRTALQSALSSGGYLVVTAGDLGAAVDRLKEVRPDLLIIRPYISSMPGQEAAAYLRTRRPGLPVLMVSGFIDDERVNTQNTVAEFHTFPKAFTAEELLAKVKEVLSATRLAGSRRS